MVFNAISACWWVARRNSRALVARAWWPLRGCTGRPTSARGSLCWAVAFSHGHSNSILGLVCQLTLQRSRVSLHRMSSRTHYSKNLNRDSYFTGPFLNAFSMFLDDWEPSPDLLTPLVRRPFVLWLVLRMTPLFPFSDCELGVRVRTLGAVPNFWLFEFKIARLAPLLPVCSSLFNEA